MLTYRCYCKRLLDSFKQLKFFCHFAEVGLLKVQVIAVILIIFTFFVLFIPTTFASTSFIIGEAKAGGYQYTVKKDQNTITWKIGHQDNLSIIKETIDNREELYRFQMAVGNIKSLIIEISISGTYFVIVVITTLIFYLKKRQIPKSALAIILMLAGIALYITFVSSIELNTAFQDAKFYYLILT